MLKEATSLEDAVSQDKSPLIIESHYEKSLPVYEDLFGEDCFKIVSLESAKKDLTGFWTKTQRFLDLDPIAFPNSQDNIENATGGKLFRMVYRLTVKPVKNHSLATYKLLMQNSFMHKSKSVLLNVLGTANKEKVSEELLSQLKIEFEPTYQYLSVLGFGEVYQ